MIADSVVKMYIVHNNKQVIESPDYDLLYNVKYIIESNNIHRLKIYNLYLDQRILMHVVIQVNLHVLNHVIEVNDEMMNLKYQFDIEIDVQLNRLI
jgi:hypothetical protein